MDTEQRHLTFSTGLVLQGKKERFIIVITDVVMKMNLWMEEKEVKRTTNLHIYTHM